jgi:hypothetical protein
MGKILPFFRREEAFDTESTTALALAYDSAVALIDSSQPDVMREVVARRIIALALKGERDPARLCAGALATVARSASNSPGAPLSRFFPGAPNPGNLQ